MLSRLFQQFTASCGVVFRTFRAFFTRQIYAVAARFKSVTSLTRQASKLAPAMLKTAADAGKKPTKREDYIETKQLFISKSLLIMVPLILVALAVLIYLVVWPWMLSHFFTARMWYEDPDAANYTGKVILYYEKEKKTVMFEGRLEEGLIQGTGRSFDENGLLLYSGDYVDGLYSGKGSLYDAGALIYEGEFADGVYSGKGSLYEDNALIYQGEFSGGAYDGTGTLYEKDGRLLYVGEFADGLRSGTGTAYADGKRCYKGEFSDDLYNGEGIQYDTDGRIRYRGSFLDGLYSGTGTLTLDHGVTVQGEFENGDVTGTAQCFLNGKLYYEGTLKQFIPDGSGTLYAASGAELFSGSMKDGVIDGGALLGVSAADLREMLLGDTTERSYEQGFSITSAELGFTAFCSYTQQDADPAVYYVFLYSPGDNSPLGELLWDTAAEFETLTETDEVRPERQRGGAAVPAFPAALPVNLDTKSYCQPYRYDGYTLNLWSAGRTDELLLLEWCLGKKLPAVTSDAVTSSASAGRLNALMNKLGMTAGQIGAAGGQAVQSVGKDAQKILQAAADRDEDVYPVLTALLTYLENKEQCAAAQENRSLYQTLADAESALLDTGKGDARQLARLKDAVAELDVQIAKYTVQMRKEARTVEDASGLDVTKYDLPGLLLLFDVSKLDTDALGRAVIKTAQDAAQEAARKAAESQAGDEAERYKEVLGLQETAAEPVDTKRLLEELEDSVLELELAYQDVQLALRQYEDDVSYVEELNQKYATGEVSKSELFTAQITMNFQRGTLYAALVEFSRQAALLDEQSGGWLASEYDWLTDVLAK